MVPDAMVVEVRYTYTASSAVFGSSRLLHIASPTLIALPIHNVVVFGTVLGHIVFIVCKIDFSRRGDAHFIVGVEADGKKDMHHHNTKETDRLVGYISRNPSQVICYQTPNHDYQIGYLTHGMFGSHHVNSDT